MMYLVGMLEIEFIFLVHFQELMQKKLFVALTKSTNYLTIFHLNKVHQFIFLTQLLMLLYSNVLSMFHFLFCSFVTAPLNLKKSKTWGEHFNPWWEWRCGISFHSTG